MKEGLFLLNLRTKRGQIGSIDTLVATIIFALMVVFIMMFWFISIGSIENVTAKNRLGTSAITISEILLKSPGVPENWEQNYSTAESLGLAVSYNDQNVLSDEKLEEFMEIPYYDAKELLGLDNSSEFYFMIEDMDYNRLYEAGMMENYSDRVVSITRFAVLSNSEPVRMRLMVYE